MAANMATQPSSPLQVPIFLTAGFRFFFLAAGLFSVFAMSAWIVWLAVHDLGGAFVSEPMSMPLHMWHGHEMIFGYTAAVMAGFFLTAVPNWTGAPSARALFVTLAGSIWLAGRFAIWFSAHLDPYLVAAIDLAFIPLLSTKIAGNLFKKTQLRNVIFMGLLIALFTGNLLMHLEWTGWSEDTATSGARLGLFTSAAMIVIIGGRVVPGFTKNALNRSGYSGRLPETHPLVDRIAILSAVLAALASAFSLPEVLLGVICLVAGSANLLRVLRWRGALTWREPILWILHLAFAMLAVSYLAFAAAYFGLAPGEISALHLMAIGAVGGMTLAMMTRASLGHTGRALVVAKPIACAYAAILVAALVRAFGPDFIGYYAAMYISGGLWIGGFTAYLWTYLPILAGQRVDGRG